jgi:ATP-dependent RNA helicase MSS116
VGGKDILAKAKTGTGKTMAFLLPTVQNLINTRAAALAAGGQQLPSGADPIRSVVGKSWHFV